MSKMGIFKVWFGWTLWLILIVSSLMFLIAHYDWFGQEWIDLGFVFVVNKLPEFKPINDMWQRGGAGCCLSAIMIGILLLMWVTRPRIWLKCPNCNARGWILNQEKYGEPYKIGRGFFSGKRQIRKRWNLCARCNHAYGHFEKEVVYDDS
jgi:hypothetical protein